MELLALAAVFTLFGIYVLAMVVSATKGHWLWFALGVFVFLFAFVGAFLPAKPGSAWARRRRR